MTMTEMFTDEELTELALAADPDAALAHDAVPFDLLYGEPGLQLLPSWYMPAPTRFNNGRHRTLKRIAVVLIIIAFLAINAYGLCSTYGRIELA
jgi:hypothetical protein